MFGEENMNKIQWEEERIFIFKALATAVKILS